MTSDAAHPSSGRVVHDAPERNADAGAGRAGDIARRLVRAARLGRRDARTQRDGRLERRVFHPKRPEHAIVDKGLERRLAHARDDFAQQLEVDVSVDEPVRRGRQHFLRGERHRRVAAHPRIGQVQIRPETRRVRQQIPNGDAILAVLAELGNERRDRVVQPHLAAFDEDHHRRRRRTTLVSGGSIVSSVMGSRCCVIARLPYAFWNGVRSPRPTARPAVCLR